MDNTPENAAVNAADALFKAMQSVWTNLPPAVVSVDLSIKGAQLFPELTVCHLVRDEPLQDFAEVLSRFRLVPIDAEQLDDAAVASGSRLRKQDAETLMRWLSVTAGAADRALPVAGQHDASPEAAAAAHGAVYRTLVMLAAEIRDEMNGGQTLASRVAGSGAALSRNSDTVQALFSL